MAKIRTERREGSRFYRDSDSQQRVPGVTSIIDMLNKPFLPPWNAKMVAELAIDSIDFLQRMAESDKQGAIDYLRHAARRYTDEASVRGTKAHDIFELEIRGQDSGEIEQELIPYRDNFRRFLDVAQPKLIRAEETVWSDEHGYAGRFDALAELLLDEDGRLDPRGEPSQKIIDYKTGKRVYPSVALQNSAYRWAERIIAQSGQVEPMPPIDGGMVLRCNAAGWELTPVRTDREVFAAFLLLREVFRWEKETSKTVLLKPIAGSARKFQTGSTRRGK
jgi:hypothetical protein